MSLRQEVLNVGADPRIVQGANVNAEHKVSFVFIP